ncbi:polysaccharide deacetylase family protein [Streptomyces olivoreticuli]|uniref:polysaccharide deacetylase family protein n=1 Tax=Streptomyces olivoreticuli TaxID=68246 RepID=UPI000E220039|nr:polysaccharide deacetylase family protein [Streptomyces olivoreticuli]
MGAPEKRKDRLVLTAVAAAVAMGVFGVFSLITQGAADGGADRDDKATRNTSHPDPGVDPEISRASEGEGKSVNLTLDDGPDPTWTPKALDLLERHDVKATFCVTGPNARSNPDLVKRIAAAGHRLCNHSVSHDVTMDRKDFAYQSQEILDAKDMIDQASGGEKIWYYRAPGGAFTPQSRKLAAENGMRPLGWNVDPGDYRRPGADRIVSRIKSQLAIGPTVLLHDGGGNRSQTLEALEELLPWLKEQGYGFSFPKA